MVSILSTNLIRLIRQLIIILCRHKHYRSKATVREMGLGFSIRANPSTEGVTKYKRFN